MPGRSRRPARASQSARRASQSPRQSDRSPSTTGAAAGPWVEPEWSRGLGHEEELPATLTAVARENGLCDGAQTDASCLQDLEASETGRQLLGAGEAVRRETALHPNSYPNAEPPAPHRRRVSERGLQHGDVGDGGAHYHFVDFGESGDETTTTQGPHASVHIGQIEERDSFDDPVQYGVQATGGLGGVRVEGDGAEASLTAPEATAEASVGQRGLVFEAGGTALEADGSVRSEALAGTRAEYALGASGRAGVRVPIEDEDGNGIPEIGLGIAAGPARAQVTTEAPFRAGRWLRRQWQGGGSD